MEDPRYLDPIFSPKTVAVIGASRNPDSIGHALTHNLISDGFCGAIYPVNPKAKVVHSIPAYARLRDIPERVDLAVISVPQKLVEGIVDECIEVKVGGLVVITAGFGETGPEGLALEQRITAKLRQAGIPMVGPNCMGVINADPKVRMNATFAPTPAREGTIGFVSQSGALGVAILNVAANIGIGLTQFVSMGNKADLSANDFLEYWEHDPKTKVIAMYLESFGNPRHFTPIAKRLSRTKPILVVKSGRTTQGAKAASSHTGALASGTDVSVSAFLDQCGVLRADTIDELFNFARTLDRCPIPSGRRVAIVTNAGGPAIMATDAAVNEGLIIAELSEDTTRHLAGILPPEASVENPVDMIASATPEKYTRTLEIVLADPDVDMVMAINVTPLRSKTMEILEAVHKARLTYPEKPVIAVMMATDDFYEAIKTRTEFPPVFSFPEPASRSLAMLARYASWTRRPHHEATLEFDVDDAAVAKILTETGEGYLPASQAFEVMNLYGIPTASPRMAENADQAVEIADELGYPVVLKGVAADLVHKSDIGAVEINLEDEAAVRQAAAAIKFALEERGHPIDGYLIQRMVRGGHETIFGLSTDPRFGPLLMFGLGGKYVEVFNDVRFASPPLVPSEAREVVRGIRGFDLLRGVRGEAPADLQILYEVLMRLAQLAERHPTILELDINPFLAGPEASSAKALDVRIRVGDPEICP